MTLAVLCSGQGGQHAAMFDLIEAEGLAAPLIARASDCARFDVVAAARSSASESMFANAIAQPLICAYQGIVWSLLDPRLEAAGAPMAMVAGYSVGELASHGCARSLSWADVIALSRVRAAAMDAATGDDDGLVAVRGLPRAVVDPIVGACGVHVAIVNGDDQFVVGGRVVELESFASRVVAHGATAQRLPVRVAAHTPLLSRAVPEFREALSKRPWNDPRVTVLAGVDGSVVRDAAAAIDALACQVATTIRWSACMDAIAERGASVCLELGPGSALARMMRERHPSIDSRSVDDFRSVQAVVDWVADRLRA